MTRAGGTFELQLKPQPLVYGSEDARAFLGRRSIDKQFYGDLEATSQGEMLSAAPTAKGAGGYVTTERVTGTLHGRTGTFVLQHNGTMNRGASQLTVTGVPDSGTKELARLIGTTVIIIVDGKHSYEFDYAPP